MGVLPPQTGRLSAGECPILVETVAGRRRRDESGADHEVAEAFALVPLLRVMHDQHLDARRVPANHELHDNMEQPGRCRAQSGRLAAKVSLSGCSS